MPAALILFSVGGVVCGQETEGQETETISSWVQDLSSESFSKRLLATQNLRAAGDSAIDPLNAALKDANADQQARIQSILKSLERNNLAELLKEIQRDPFSEKISQFPEWSRYSRLVGKSKDDRVFFLRMLVVEAPLFSVAMKDVRGVRNPLRIRAAELLQDIREIVRKSESDTVKMESYAALLLLAGNDKLLLRGDTSTSLNSVLLSAAFERQIAKSGGERYLKLAGAYIQRPNIAVVHPLRFARKFKTKEGLLLARRVLKSTLRGIDGQMALIVVQEQGDESDLPLVESLFDHTGILAQGRRSNADASQSYTATSGDLAVAVAVSLRKEDPRKFGFSRTDNVGEEFRFALDTIGFSSDKDRVRSRTMYRKRWSQDADK